MLLVAVVTAAYAVRLVTRGGADAPEVATATDAATSPDRDESAARPAPAPAPEPPRAVLIGDSWLDGAGASSPGVGMANLVSEELGWRSRNLSRPGMGYIAGGRDSSGPFASRVDEALAQGTDYVVVAGGLADYGALFKRKEGGLAQTGRRALSLFQRIEADAPEAALVVVGPWWPDTPEHALPGIQAIRDRVRDAAAATDAVWIDPLGGGWINGRNSGRFLDQETLVPNDAGHAYLARRLAAAIREVVPETQPAGQVAGD